jgi:hypothetical protein
MASHDDQHAGHFDSTPSNGILEIQQQKSAALFFNEVHAFLATVNTLTPTQRFELTQRALKDMQSVMASHKLAQDKAIHAMELAERRSREVRCCTNMYARHVC